MSSTTLSCPKTLDANWPAVRAKNFVKALKMKPGKNYAENMAILAAKASVTVEELIVMNPVRYAERNGMKCRELLGRAVFDHFYWKNGPAVPTVAVAVAVATPAAAAVTAPLQGPTEAKDICTLRMTNNTMQELEPYYRNVKLPPGTYYIGDLCYPLGNSWIYMEAWDAINYTTPAYFRSKSGCIVVDRTACGDGFYSDIDKRSYSVDAGVLSIVSIELIENHLKYLTSLHNRLYHKLPNPHTMAKLTDGGHVFTFQEEVTINFGQGLFRVWSGDTRVWINTDPSDFEDGYEDDE